MQNNRKTFLWITLLLIIILSIVGNPIKLNNDSRDGVIATESDATSESSESEDPSDMEGTQTTEGDHAAAETPETEEPPDTENSEATEEESEKPTVDEAYVEPREEKILEIIEDMTTEEKVAQLFFIKNDNRFDYHILETIPAGGVILFASDFRYKSIEQLTEHISLFQENTKVPLFIGVDEEGGKVIRLSKYARFNPCPFASPQDLYEGGGFDSIEEDTITKSRVLLSYGINVNFAPVADISTDPSEYMYNRSFGKDPQQTAEYIRLVIETMNDEKIGSVIKHFPGYGPNGDTHSNIIYDGREYDEFLENDFIPFIEGIDAGAECILVSHNIVKSIDPDWPASLSTNINEILRDDLDFKGVIITDDLMMDGVSRFINMKEAPVRAIQAGNDMILSTDFGVQYQAVLDAVDNNTISIERIDESVMRILRWKYNLGIIE